jgi:hypothetical protein
MEGALVPWFEQAIAVGQRARAVRKDVPASLLIAVVFAMGQAMDTWLITQPLDATSLGKWVAIFIGMLRRTLSP